MDRLVPWWLFAGWVAGGMSNLARCNLVKNALYQKHCYEAVRRMLVARLRVCLFVSVLDDPLVSWFTKQYPLTL